MKALIIQSEYSCHDCENGIENEEVWLMPHGEERDVAKIAKEWKENKEEFPQFYQWMEYHGGQLINFDEFIKNN